MFAAIFFTYGSFTRNIIMETFDMAIILTAAELETIVGGGGAECDMQADKAAE
jgi:hypothetical protein